MYGSALQAFAGLMGTLLVVGNAVLLWQFRQLHDRIDAVECRSPRDGEETRKADAADLRRLETAFHTHQLAQAELRAELPREYVRREDWIRFSAQIDAKLDTTWAKLDRIWAKIDGGNHA